MTSISKAQSRQLFINKGISHVWRSIIGVTLIMPSTRFIVVENNYRRLTLTRTHSGAVVQSLAFAGLRAEAADFMDGIYSVLST